MKKVVLRVLLAIIVLVMVGLVVAVLFLSGMVKSGIEAAGPKLLQVEVKLQSVNLSLLSGKGKLNGLVVGNPSGYKSPSAMQIGEATLELVPRSLLADKVVIRSINLQAPEITFETDLKGNNLSKLLANLEATTGGAEKKAPASPEKKSRNLEVDDFRISDGKIHVLVSVLGGKSATVALPEVHLQNLGQGPEGITSAELTQLVLQAVLERASQAAPSVALELTKGIFDPGKGLPAAGSNDLEKAAKSLLNRLNHKKP